MSQQKIGVLLANLGTPSEPTTAGVKRYLREFLSDKRVVDTPRLLWWPLLRGVILPLRSGRVAKLYQSIWMNEGSPLLVYSKRQEAELAKLLPETPVVLGMSYGDPSIQRAVDKLLAQKVTHIIVLPLYPQYSCSTVAAVWDAVGRVFSKTRYMPSISLIRDYATEPSYINALAASVHRAFDTHGKPDLLLLSYHGIPQRFANEGDDYPVRCQDTTQALQKTLGLSSDKIMMTYQSRFGREPWLMPYTDETLKTLPAKGIKHIQVMCPGFSADCLETLEEMAKENREIFLEAGGEKYEYIPSLNDSPEHIEMMKSLVERYRK